MTDNTINDDMTMGGPNGALLAGRYRVVRPLGQGGMGSVWLAEDVKLDGFKVAIKMLPSVLVNNKRTYAQVKSEALVSLKLSHSNIATVRAFEEESGNPFLVMDYIDGQTLDDYLAEKGKLTEEETIKLLKPVAAALDYAHTQGVVHRDVKPGNVMIRKDGTPFVLDFGIAREIQETMTRVTGKLSSGTLLYMSPEQLNGDAPKPAQDIYSFAAMAYECLRGEPPFARGGIEDQIKHKTPKHLNEKVAICTSVMAGLEKEPLKRPQSCVAVVGVEVVHTVSELRQKRPLPDVAIVIPEQDLQYLPPGERALLETRVHNDDHVSVELEHSPLSVCKDPLSSGHAEVQTSTSKARGLVVGMVLLLAALGGVGGWFWCEKSENDALLAEHECQSELAKQIASEKKVVREDSQNGGLTADEKCKNADSIFAQFERMHKDKLARIESHNVGDAKTITLPGGVTIEFVWCPPGSFMMGSPESEEGHSSRETQHRVTLTRGFWMGKYEVTQRQWECVMGGNPSHFKGKDRPVENVSWDDCQEFIRKINANGQVAVALPTEAQWEYACRAGATTPFNFGSTLNGDNANCNGNYPYGTLKKGAYRGETTDVGSYVPNAWGLYDTHGNVLEWCADWYANYTGDVTDPTVPASGGVRVYRGGGWSSNARDCRSALRLRYRSSGHSNYIGFRLVCSEGPCK